MISFEMIHIKTVEDINAYICCIATYDIALHTVYKRGTCKLLFRIAIVSVDSSLAKITVRSNS